MQRSFGALAAAILTGALTAATLAITLLAGASPAGAQGAARALPAGEGRDVVAVACSQCHPLNVVMSLREGPTGWRRHVTNMVTRGAQLTPHEADTVVTYLSTAFGVGSPPAGAVAVTLPPGPGKELVETRCTLCHDLERVAVVKRQKSDWPVLVANMVGRGAPVSPEEAQAITSYLAAHFGGG